ncbi:MAG: pantetheine-phosphate adenylyltransferase [Clostridia bacterium]|nr:pantetheine-phosphate adenylyltransferase [Clostridia bacterium]
MVQRIAIYPGSFDPVTNGHLDIIRRSAKIFDKVVVGVLKNGEKTPAFSPEERVDMLKRATADISNVEAKFFNGLLVDFVKQENASVIIKGLRAVSDFEYEFQLALLNSKLAPEIETMFLATSEQYCFLSSSIVRDIARHGGSLKDLVPDELIAPIYEKLRKF